MGFLKHFRSKSKLKEAAVSKSPSPRSAQPARYGRDFTARLGEEELERIFGFVCPHALDDTYESSERSMIGDGCMLCDLRDLANCARVCLKWYQVAQKLLYGSVRIDAVHYCELEEILSEKRHRKSFMGKHGEPIDAPTIRLQLLSQTVRNSPGLASQVKLLKLPYMTRETCKADLARTVSVLPNLRYVDLPEGFYTGDASSHTLRQELHARCPDIRRMKYNSGSESALELLTHRHWQSLETLELSEIAVEPSTLRSVLGSLPTLQALKIADLAWLDDQIFASAPSLPEFPALHSLSLENTPRITAEGLRTYLSAPHVREVFSSLSLRTTGVTIPDLGTVLWAATHLHDLSIIETVTRSLPLTKPLSSLTSISLRTMHFEITSDESVHGLQKPAESYYQYLVQSLHSNSLPALEELYVRDPDFPELMLLAPPVPTFAGDSPQRSNSPTAGFNQTLCVYSKGLDELDWVHTSLTPSPIHSRGRRGSMLSVSSGRPMSSYSASRGLGPQWAMGGEARRSVIVGNGFGGFLAVPQDELPSPGNAHAHARQGSTSSSFGGQSGGSGSLRGMSASWLKPPPSIAGSAGSGGHERRGSRHDLWR
ncbi:hypothetical protein B0A49_02493 [Cryomyces minteri]|uniref:F-box domain-containing protein n=1 Tax=Cryomyces minteri TaxID=331657 RepID=A0A4U0XXR0_9PEZI|nr:hypothetical protein B0A49_02493 [Cryomyces minteri]